MITKMETYYYKLVSHTGRFLTVQMIWFLKNGAARGLNQ